MPLQVEPEKNMGKDERRFQSLPPVTGKCPEGTKGVGTGGAKRRLMRDWMQRISALQYRSCAHPSSGAFSPLPPHIFLPSDLKTHS